MTVEIKIEGLKEMAAALRKLPENVANKILSGAVSPAAAMIRDAARRMAPVYQGDVSAGHPPPGTLQKAIFIAKLRTEKTTAHYIVWVKHGTRFQKVGKKLTNQDAYYWTWVEFGTAKSRAHPFLRPAYEALKGDALRVITTNLDKGIQAEAKAVAWGVPK